MTMLYSSDSLVGQLTNEHPMGIITTPGCEKYVLSVLTPFHLTTCRSGSKASFFPIKVRVSCAQYEQHEIDDMPENAHTNASDHLKTTFRLFVTPWDRVDTIIQNLVTFCIYKMIIILQRDNYPTQVKREKEERRRRREQGKNAQ